MAGIAAFGTQFKKGAVAFANVTNISGPGLSLDTEDVTAHDSTGAWEEVVATIVRSGEITLDINYDPSNATHKYIADGLLYDLVNKTDVTTFTLVFPGPVTWSFAHAFVTGFEPGAPHEGKLTASVKIKPSGVTTLA